MGEGRPPARSALLRSTRPSAPTAEELGAAASMAIGPASASSERSGEEEALAAALEGGEGTLGEEGRPRARRLKKEGRGEAGRGAPPRSRHVPLLPFQRGEGDERGLTAGPGGGGKKKKKGKRGEVPAGPKRGNWAGAKRKRPGKKRNSVFYYKINGREKKDKKKNHVTSKINIKICFGTPMIYRIFRKCFGPKLFKFSKKHLNKFKSSLNYSPIFWTR